MVMGDWSPFTPTSVVTTVRNMAVIEISPAAAGAATTAVDALVASLEVEGQYPDLSYDDAPLAMTASQEVGERWVVRLRQEVQGGETLAQAFSLAAEIFEAGDSELKSALAELHYVDMVDAGGN